MSENQQIKLTLLHIGIGLVIALSPSLSIFYQVLIVTLGFYITIRNKNQNNEILYVIAYIAGSEVFLRATTGNALYEFGKYSMLLFTLLGLFYSGLPKWKNPYWIYLALLLPSVVMGLMYLEEDVRRKITFEVLGPICVGALALYTYKRKISANGIKSLLTFAALPILAMCTYLILRYSQTDYHVKWCISNFYFSGDFGPNQVATALGLGMVIYLLKVITDSPSRKLFWINVVIFCLIFYRGLLTFSRGGMATAILVIFVLFLAIYLSREGLYKIKRKFLALVLILTAIFSLTAYQTENSLFKRYTKCVIPNSNGKMKNKGRYMQVQSDIRIFSEHPLMGVGTGKAIEIRTREYDKKLSTHTEITRLLSEHGILGLLCLLILIFYPLQHYFSNLRSFYLLPFFVFWLLSINHSATRTIAPLFLYALALMQINVEKEESQVKA